MPEYTQAELLRSPLEATLLQLLSLGLTDLRAFGWPQPPAPERVDAALRGLEAMGAITPGCAPPLPHPAAPTGSETPPSAAAGAAAPQGAVQRLTPLGGALAALPLELPAAVLLLLGELLEVRVRRA